MRSTRRETGRGAVGIEVADDDRLGRIGTAGGGGDHADGERGVDAGAVGDGGLEDFPTGTLPRLLPGESAGEGGVPELGGEQRRGGVVVGEIDGEAGGVLVGADVGLGDPVNFDRDALGGLAVGSEEGEGDFLLGLGAGEDEGRAGGLGLGESGLDQEARGQQGGQENSPATNELHPTGTHEKSIDCFRFGRTSNESDKAVS